METIHRGCSNSTIFPATPLVKDEAANIRCIYKQDDVVKIIVPMENIKWIEHDNYLRVILDPHQSLFLEGGREVQIQLKAVTKHGTHIHTDVMTAFVDWSI